MARVGAEVKIKFRTSDPAAHGASYRECALPFTRGTRDERATYPLERCTIYDAGSRAFDLPEYFHDVREYWEQTLALARRGVTFDALVSERFPGLDTKRFGPQDLAAVCEDQIERIPL